jgi:tetratricopeptide (TPR) repeat protein
LLLLSFSDVRVTLGDHADALRRAERALAIAERQLRSNPGDEKLMRHVYAAGFRIGDEKALAGDNAEAERQYNKALAHARQRERLKPDDLQRKRDVAFILNKLADIERAKGNGATALGYYNEGLKIAEAVAEKYPIDRATQKNRIAQLLSERKDIAGALAQYREALAIQMELLRTTPDDATLVSNAAITRRRIGQLLKDKPGEALPELQAAVAYRRKLFEGDPSSVPWRTGLAFDQKLLGDILFALEDYRGAAQAYAAASQIEEGLVLKDPANLGWQRNLAATNIKRGDLLIARAEARENPEPAVDDNTRRSRDALARYQRAAEISERLLPQRAAGADRFANLFKARIKVGDTLARLFDHAAALDSYQAALAVVALAPPSEPVTTWYVEVADSIREACEFVEKGPSTPALAGRDQGDALTCYQKALAAIEAAAAKAPDNAEVKEKKVVLSTKVQALQSAAK